MPKPCREPDCHSDAVVKGLCRRHYERVRRRNGSQSHRPGAKPKYPLEVRERFRGAPVLTVRMPPELWNWIQQHGGSAWVRQLLTRLEHLSNDEGFAECWRQLSQLDDQTGAASGPEAK